MPQHNQYKPSVPAEEIEQHARKYFAQGVLKPKMLKLLKRHYDADVYTLCDSTLKRYYQQWGLQGTKKQKHTVATLHAPIQELRKSLPTIGAGELTARLRTGMGIKASKKTVLEYLHTTEPQAVRARKGKRYIRKQFYVAGIGHMWCIDQHDKMKRFGLYYHICVEAGSGKIIWLVVWWTNSNPRWATRQYGVAGRKYGIPLLMQSDLGSENYGIANAHTSIRQHLDPSLAGTLQHRWMNGHSNIKPEIAWKQFRVRCAPGLEQLFDKELYGAYNPTNALQKLLFRWLAIPFVQGNLDEYIAHHNNTRRRADKHKILPNGIPDDIFDHSEDYGMPNYHIPVPEDVFEAAEAQWAPADHAVFELVPAVFGIFVFDLWERSARPESTFETFWAIYQHLHMMALAELPTRHDVQQVVGFYGNVHDAGEDQGFPLMPHVYAGDFGVAGVPNAIIIEEMIHSMNDQNTGDVNLVGSILEEVQDSDINTAIRDHNSDMAMDDQRGDIEVNGQIPSVAMSEAEHEAWFSD